MEDALNRIKTAVEFLKDGQSFKVGDLRIGIEEKNNLYVTGWTQYLHIENLSKTQALKELMEVKNLFMEMVNISSDLKEFIQNKRVKFNLAFNYGMGSISICSEENGLITWEKELKS
jgi:hypothetical protein